MYNAYPLATPVMGSCVQWQFGFQYTESENILIHKEGKKAANTFVSILDLYTFHINDPFSQQPLFKGGLEIPILLMKKTEAQRHYVNSS